MNIWDEYIQYFSYCYNTSKHSAFDNKYSSYELIFGKNPREFNEILKNAVESIYNIDSYLSELKYKLQKICSMLRYDTSRAYPLCVYTCLGPL